MVEGQIRPLPYVLDVWRMKRLPLVLALLTASFLTICLFQLEGRGIGFVPPLTDWELHPAWWHFNFLADCGEYLVEIPSLYIALLEAWITQLFTSSEFETWPAFFQGLFSWMAFGLPIAIESLIVFYITRTFAFYISRHRKLH